MKEIELTRGKFVTVDDEDYAELSKHKWCTLVTDTGRFYAMRSSKKEDGFDKKKTILMHRIIMGEIPSGMVIDHKNGNGLDNRRENLRICTQSQNQTNKKKKGTSSKYKGVYYDKARDKFRSHIIVDGKTIFLGRFNTELEAALAYDKASNEYHGEFANNNKLL